MCASMYWSGRISSPHVNENEDEEDYNDPRHDCLPLLGSVSEAFILLQLSALFHWGPFEVVSSLIHCVHDVTSENRRKIFKHFFNSFV